MATLTDANVKTQPQENSMENGGYKCRIKVTFSDRRSVVAINTIYVEKPAIGWIRPRGKK